MVLLRRCEDRAVEALSCSGQAVQKVRLDFGWEGALVGEGIEGVEMEWNALCYDITVSLLPMLHLLHSGIVDMCWQTLLAVPACCLMSRVFHIAESHGRSCSSQLILPDRQIPVWPSRV